MYFIHRLYLGLIFGFLVAAFVTGFGKTIALYTYCFEKRQFEKFTSYNLAIVISTSMGLALEIKHFLASSRDA